MNPNPALGVFFHWLGGLASGQLLRPLSRSQELGVGNLLAGWRLFQLDHRAMVVGADYDSRPQSGAAPGADAARSFGPTSLACSGDSEV